MILSTLASIAKRITFSLRRKVACTKIFREKLGDRVTVIIYDEALHHLIHIYIYILNARCTRICPRET